MLKKADYVGSTSGMLNWVKQFDGSPDAVIFVATEDGILYNMGLARPAWTCARHRSTPAANATPVLI